MSRIAQYPYHLAKLVTARLRGDHGISLPETVLTRLLETLYFASLKTEEGRPILCTVNYVDPASQSADALSPLPADRWSLIPFETPLPFDVRSLSKLAKAADPTVSSLAVFSDRQNQLFIWGMLDQKVRYSDYIALDSASTPEFPGLFHATINGVGNIAVHVDYTLIGSLEQNSLIEEYHDVLWSGPVHQMLATHLESYLAEAERCGEVDWSGADYQQLRSELLVRWLNAICRILMNIQHYRHGGGLIIAPASSLGSLDVKYKLHYDRLPRSLLGIVRNEFYRAQLSASVRRLCDEADERVLPCDLHHDLRSSRRKFDEHKNAVLGCAHFIAALSCVDGFIFMDDRLAVRGFGAEVRTENQMRRIFLADDSDARPELLREADLTQFGTRHRAMMRYCHEHPGAIGFVVSQDSDVRAMTRLGDRLVLWENIEVQLAFKVENRYLLGHEPVLRLPPSQDKVA